MDRRSFIKLTAVTGTTATLASCGNPENQLIRFVPDEDIVPGHAVWKPSVCPLCAVRMRSDGARHGCRCGRRARTVRPASFESCAAKKLEGNPDHPVNRGGLCARGQAGDSGDVSSRSDHAATQAVRQSWQRPVRGDHLGAAIAEVVAGSMRWRRRQPASARVCRGAPDAGQRARPDRQFLSRFGAAAGSHLRAVRRRRAAAGECAEFRQRAVADASTSRSARSSSVSAPICSAPGTRRSRSAAATARCGRARGRSRRVRPGRVAHVADRCQRGRVGAGRRAPKECWPSASRT